MKWIPLTKGKSAVDDATYEVIKHYNWCTQASGKAQYAVRSMQAEGRRHRVWLHRMVAGYPKPWKIVHVDGDRLNNCARNLLVLRENGTVVDNPYASRIGHSQWQGVTWDAYYGVWRTGIDTMHIGYFDTEIGAALAYNQWVRKLKTMRIEENKVEV